MAQENPHLFFRPVLLSMLASNISEKVSKVAGYLPDWRSLLERFRLGRGPKVHGRLGLIVSWIPLYILSAYVLDYVETVIGTGVGIAELNPLIVNLSRLFGILATPTMFLLVMSGVYYLASIYQRDPKAVAVILFAIAAFESVSIARNLLILVQTAANNQLAIR